MELEETGKFGESSRLLIDDTSVGFRLRINRQGRLGINIDYLLIYDEKIKGCRVNDVSFKVGIYSNLIHNIYLYVPEIFLKSSNSVDLVQLLSGNLRTTINQLRENVIP